VNDLLTISGLHAGYGPVEVLHGLDLTVGDGEVVVVLGANGAGKTTTMRAVSGVIQRRGTITFDGNDIAHATADEQRRHHAVRDNDAGEREREREARYSQEPPPCASQPRPRYHCAGSDDSATLDTHERR